MFSLFVYTEQKSVPNTSTVFRKQTVSQ